MKLDWLKIDKALRRLFLTTKAEWLQPQNASTRARNLVSLEGLERKLTAIEKDKRPREVKYIRLHMARCFWLCSQHTTTAEYNNKIDDAGKISESQFKNQQREWAYIWLLRILSERDRTTDVTLSCHLDELDDLDFSREYMVRKIVLSQGDQLSAFFERSNGKLDSASHVRLRAVIEWFVTRRYDFATIRILVKHNYGKNGKIPFFFRFGWLMWSFLSALALALAGYLWVLKNDLYMVKGAEFILNRPRALGAAFVILLNAGLAGKVVDLFFYPLKAVLLTPRLIASLIIGFLPLVLAKDIWLFAFSRNWPELTFMTLSGLLLSFVYIRHEVFKSLGEKHLASAWRRSIRLFGRSLAYSFGIGYLLMDWFGEFFLNAALKQMTYADISPVLWGFLGCIPLKPLCLFLAMALMLGVILQMIWEEKPITEPL